MAADRCAGCTNKYGFFERPSVCPECHRNFCQTCLPYRGKKVKKSEPQVALEACVYCKRKEALKESQEKEVLSNFQERYYNRAHVDPPIQSTLRLDLVTKQNSSPAQLHRGQGTELSSEDRALEERLRKLRESSQKSSVTPSFNEEEMRTRLAGLREEVDKSKGTKDNVGEGRDPEAKSSETKPPTANSLDSQHSGTTQTEQADRLMEQAADEARIDDRLSRDNEDRDEKLMERFQNLKGKKDAGKGSGFNQDSKPTKTKLNFDVDELLGGIDDPILPEEDAEKLLQDLKSLQAKEEIAAVKDAQSEDVQQLISMAQKLAKEEGTDVKEEGADDPLPNKIVYPVLAGLESADSENTTPTPGAPSSKDVSSAEVAKMLEEGREELKKDQEQHEANLKFLKETSERMDRLRNDEPHAASSDLPDDEVVKSKPKPEVTVAPPNLEFSWGHFGGHSADIHDRDFPTEVGGASCGDGFPGENREQFDDEVQDLIARMLEEAELDRRLEASGFGEDKGKDNPAAEHKVQADKTSPAGATAQYPGGMGGACGVDNFDDLPWCCICNDDASICCYDCDSDLYCQRCFADGHQQFGLVDHKYAPFRPSTK